MKSAISLLLITIWLICPLADQAMGEGGADLYVADPVLEMGDVLEGEPLRGNFTVANRGQRPLLISKVGSSAGGIVHGYARQIAPGRTGVIEIGFNTWNMPGASECSFFVYTNDHDTPRLKLRARAQVTPRISVEPDRVYFSGFSDQTYQTAITLKGNADTPLKITSITDSLGGRVTYRLKPMDGGSIYRLEVSAQPAPGSYFRGRIALETSYTEKPKLYIPVLVRILPDVEVMPMSIDFGLRRHKDYVKPSPEKKILVKDWQANRNKLPRTVFLRVNRGEAVQVTGIILENKLFEKKLHIGEEGRLYRVTLTPLIEQMKPGQHHGLLKILTDHPQQSTFDVPLRISVK